MSSSFIPYWCHSCSQHVSLQQREPRCPLCNGEFVEELSGATPDGTGGFLISPAALLLAHSHLSSLERGIVERQGNRGRHRRSAFEGRNRSESRFDVLQLFDAPFGPHVYSREFDLLNGDQSSSRQDAREEMRLSVTSLEDRVHTLDTDEDYGVVLTGNNGRRSRRLFEVRDFFLGPGLDHLIHQLSERDSLTYGTAPASKSAVEAMPTLKITKENLESDDAHCAVCKEIFEVGGEVRQMPCKHIYHSDCILPWLDLHSSCPVCRHEIAIEDSSNGQPVTTVDSNSYAISNLSRPRRDRNAERGLAFFELPGGGIHVRSLTLWGVDRNGGGDVENEGLEISDNVLTSLLETGRIGGLVGDNGELSQRSARVFFTGRDRSSSRWTGINFFPFRSWSSRTSSSRHGEATTSRSNRRSGWNRWFCFSS